MGRIRTLGQFVSNLSKRDKKDLKTFVTNRTNPDAFKNYFSSRVEPGTNVANIRFTNPEKNFIANLIGVPVEDIGRRGNPVGTRVALTDERKALAGTGGTATTAKQALNPSLITYERQLALAAKQFGYSIRDVKANPTKYPEVYGSVQAMRGSNIVYPKKNLTYPKALDQSGFTAGDFSGIIGARGDLAREMMNRNTFSILDDLGIIAPNIRSSSIGHTIPLQALRDSSMIQSFNPFRFKRGIDKEGVKSLITNPNLMVAEPTFMNTAKRGIESFLYNPSNRLRNLRGVGDILDEAGMTTTVLDPKTLSMSTFGAGRPMDVKQLNEYLKRIRDDAPFGVSSKTGKNLLFPTTQFLRRNFFRGGIASLLE
jgi:hypothetical protein